VRNILAGEAPADDVGFSGGKLSRCDVVVLLDVRPVLCEDSPTERLDFAEGDGLHSGSFKAKAETSFS
jgi:hypothetical protein